MTLQEFYTLQEETFDSFCKTLIRNESINAHKEYAFRAQTETPLQDLSGNEQQQLAHEDTYDSLATHFIVRGENVYVRDPDLSDALRFLPPKRREVILLSYFLGRTDNEIGRLLKIDPRAVGYRREAALKKLREFLEEIPYE